MDSAIYRELPGVTPPYPYMNFGESIVWQCTNPMEFQTIVLPYTVLNNRRPLIKHLCFNRDPSYMLEDHRIITYYLNADDGFESFTYQVYSIILSSSPNTIFIFDFLSRLHSSWASDMMMANFFRILCPILSESKSSGIFPILRGQHSYQAISDIKHTADVFMDIQIRDQAVRLQEFRRHKQKLNYYEMLGHPACFTAVEHPSADFNDTVISRKSEDIWERYFDALQILSESGILSETEHQKVCQRLMTQEEHMKQLIVTHFSAKDYIRISKKMVGTGKIGGKACGFLLGRKLIETYLPDAAAYMEPIDSYFIGTDVFYSYMVVNHCWSLRLQHRLEQDQFKEIGRYREALLHGTFPPSIRKQFCRMLLHYGNTPIVIRSSSFLEDGYGNAFSGKYESVFCKNQGTLKERLLELEAAIRKVYASTLSLSALEYRRKRNLLGQDEQMALLVQNVSGKQYGDLYFPLASGVSFSYNPYRWMEHISPEAGMVRLVAGLGTRAVNRTPGDYPRLVGLDRPQAMLWSTTKDRHKYSQRYLDVFNLSTGQVEETACEKILKFLTPQQRKLIFSHDTEAESRLLQQGRYQNVYFTDCQGIVDNRSYIDFLKRSLKLLETQYGCPVDIEFALCARENGVIGFDLLQCRPLKHHTDSRIEIKKHDNTDVLFDISQASISNSKEETIDLIVLIDPRAYYQTPYHLKPQIASIIGTINKQIEGNHGILLVPGRIGTSSPELGVPVSYTEVNQFSAICEISYSAAGYNPELSYGSHMFQDLVEADIFYAAINENRNTRCYQPERLRQFDDLYDRLCPAFPEFHSVVHVYDLSHDPGSLYLDAAHGHALCVLSGKKA